MKIANITPLNYLKMSDKYSDMHLLLLHWAMKNGTYTNFFRKCKTYKILDNSFYELRKEIDINDLFTYAHEMKVQEIVAPDVMYNFKRTKELVEKFIDKCPSRFKIQTVVCGRNFDEYHKCFVWMDGHEHIDVVALSKHGLKPECKRIISDSDFYYTRADYLSGIYHTASKPIHLLGVNSILDYFSVGVRSMDSKWAAKMANYRHKIDLHTLLEPSRLKAYLQLLELIKDEIQIK